MIVPPLISLVVAMDEGRVIGRDNQLAWSLPDDLKHFRHLTLGKPVIMGRKTHQSIGRPLPERLNVVMTRDPQYVAAGCTVVHSLAEALAAAGSAPEVMGIGGASVFSDLLPHASRIYLTQVHARYEGDVLFPPLPEGVWREVERVRHEADSRHLVPFTFLTLERTSVN